jgi:hypothetical protein
MKRFAIIGYYIFSQRHKNNAKAFAGNLCSDKRFGQEYCFEK